MDVDHKNGNTLDNRFLNLRPATRSQNNCNTPARKDNTSGCKGVSWDKNYNKWQTYIQIDKKRISLGRFNDFNEACNVRKEAEIKHYGEFRYQGIN